MPNDENAESHETPETPSEAPKTSATPQAGGTTPQADGPPQGAEAAQIADAARTAAPDNAAADAAQPLRIPAPGGRGAEQQGGIGGARSHSRSRRRYLVPAAVAAAVVAGVAAVPALAAQSDLPSITAQQLLAKTLSSKVQTFSGNVQATVDLGLPAGISSVLPSALASAGAGAGGGAATAQQTQAEQQLLALVSGGTHTFQVAADGPDRQRVSSTDSGTAFTAVHNGSSAWLYDVSSNTATHVTGLRSAATGATEAPSGAPTTPQEAASDALKALGPNTSVSVAGTSKVAGQSVYELSVKPKGTGSTVGEVRIAVDGANGLPLQVRVDPSNGGDPILNVGFATVSFSTPAASTFSFTPPKGATVNESPAPSGKNDSGTAGVGGTKGTPAPNNSAPNNGAMDLRSKITVIGSGWTTIYRYTPTGSDVSDLSSAAKAFGKPVTGGTLVSTSLINVLVTDKGSILAGAVTPALLEQAAAK